MGRVLLVALCLCLCACSTPASRSAPVSSPAATAPPTVAPSVPVAGDLAPYLGKACDLLSADQAAQAGLAAPEAQGESPELGYCIWEGDPRLGLGVHTTGDPLGDLYRASSYWEVFTPVTVAGQPAVLTSTTEPGTACRLTVGTAPGQGLTLDLSGKAAGTDWCTRIEHVAEAVLAHLRG